MQHSESDVYTLGAYPCYPELYPSQVGNFHAGRAVIQLSFVLFIIISHASSYFLVLSAFQTFYISNSGELRREQECAVRKQGKSEIEMVQCEHLVGREETWTYENEQIMNENSKKCLTITVESGKGTLSLEPCNTSADNQKWIFDKERGKTL